MNPSCKACRLDMWVVGYLLVCPRCDTAPHDGGHRWGPPNTPYTDDGQFKATFKDVR